ncbi:heterokaryon incompatibility protein-domain-containing protein [Ustulina deusta]|nr:heterokaryon incompatibility protein-domain-containing protein [Ustulina deusta]
MSLSLSGDLFESHECRQHHIENQPNKYTLPTRLLNVNPLDNPDDLRLDVSEKIETDRYIALSHCWGQSDPDRHPLHCTIEDNVERRQSGFKLSELPKTFRDAIEVTRELDVQYLWIDSICIIQDRRDDWEQESKRMEQVFALAYCTIAATSAENPNAGFLGRQVDHDNIYVQDPQGRRIYVSTNVANFDNNINSANLNKQAWVMQEKFLSPRTIHFGKNQIYGECRKEVYAGSKIFLTYRDQSKKYFRLNPAFPSRLRRSGWVATLEFLQSLLKDYTQRGISIPTDRAVAISGLITRIGKALPCKFELLIG